VRDLPLPDSPTRAGVSPFSMSKLTSWTAGSQRSPIGKPVERCRTESSGIAGVGIVPDGLRRRPSSSGRRPSPLPAFVIRPSAFASRSALVIRPSAFASPSAVGCCRYPEPGTRYPDHVTARALPFPQCRRYNPLRFRQSPPDASSNEQQLALDRTDPPRRSGVPRRAACRSPACVPEGRSVWTTP